MCSLRGSLVQLGFVQESTEERNNRELLKSSDWKNWDGGKVGGFPV